MTIQEAIRTYDNETTEHGRYRSWEHCYAYFRAARAAGTVNRDHAALHLGFFLASWGMYRGSSFLPDYTYTVHLGVIDTLFLTRFSTLWELDFGNGPTNNTVVPIILDAASAIRDSYQSFADVSNSAASDTLVTKIMLATFGCLPACDRYFIDGFTGSGFKYSYVNGNFVRRILGFCRENLAILQAEQIRIEDARQIRYPLMKLVDMCFWQLGFEADSSTSMSKAAGI
jgi:hypothetical protein